MKYTATKITITFVVVLNILSCASLRKFNEEEIDKFNSVKIIKNESSLDAKCKFVKPVTVSSGDGSGFTYVVGNYENAMLLLQEKALKENADTALIDSFQAPQLTNTMVNGTSTQTYATVTYDINARLYTCNN